jgi:hypothetical protein
MNRKGKGRNKGVTFINEIFTFIKEVIDEDIIAFLKRRKPGLFVSFGQFLCSWIWIRIFTIRIRIQDSQINKDPCGSGPHNTAGSPQN